MNVAIITARGGSKRIPGKNTRLFSAKPIIAYSIRAAIESGLFDRVIVSTDSDKIAAIAEDYGADVPFRRPANLSDDLTATAPVLEHALKWLGEHGGVPDYACCIYPTAPFVRKRYLAEGFEALKEFGCTTTFSATSFAFPIFRSLKIDEEGRVEMFWPEHELTRSQDLPEAYHDAGQFYWLNCEKFLREPRLYASDSRAIILPRKLVQDIDTPEDWETAESMFKAQGLELGG